MRTGSRRTRVEGTEAAPARSVSPKPDSGHASRTAKVSMVYAWALAFAPLIWSLLDALEPRIPDSAGNLSDLPAVVAVALNVGLAWLDRARLSRAGIHVPDWLVVLVPLYVVARTKRAETTAAVPVVWFISLLVALVVVNTT
jgi:hypothetical protein